ncbi:hypothetical protein Z042_26350 [Chania multitudinisentens RB-25]|uniref:YdgH/BhsA/McbA-like domain-containing protein n=1 Tax=Chania multitudinisentens RB-25 TaxID=1441930 RepID=A0A0D4ZYJ0_9GAMM|nr:DUF1471 domain-containing protein [Chania multitudinisentens]AJW28963.1 hypothetical protein Z042_26350 [Chania multitudinisentens RB-25]
MKNITVNLSLAAGLFSASALATLPQPPNVYRVGNMTVSTLAEVEKGIAERAKAKNASYYRIISVSGNNKLHASTVIYR